MRRKNYWFVLLCGIFLLLSGCSSGREEGGGPAMGRYLEEVLPLPEDLLSLQYLDIMPDGSFLLIGETSRQPLQVWRSGDGGETWSTESPDWLRMLGQYNINAMALDTDGSVWFTDEVPDPALDAILESEDEDALDSYIPPVNPLYLIENGSAALQDAQLRDSTGVNANHFLLQGDYLAASAGNIMVFDRVNGKKLLEAEAEQFTDSGNYFLDGNTLAVSGSTGMTLYNVESGARTGLLQFQTEAVRQQDTDFFSAIPFLTPIARTTEEGVYAYCNSSGIYRLSADGLIQEKVVSGELTSLTMPTLNLKKLFVTEDSYYVFVTDKESKPWRISGASLLRYRYDPEIPSQPTIELSIYALHDMPTVRQAIGVFQREHSEVWVRFEIASESAEGITTEDSLRVLATELLAGKGPDILILDGMPAESYFEKGLLLDLNGRLPAERIAQIPSNLMHSCEENDVIFAVPARFTIPMILGDPDVLAATSDPDGLASCITGLDSPQIGVLPSELFRLLYPVFGPSWFREDGTLDETAAASGLESINRILELYDGKDESRLWNTSGNVLAGTIGWLDGWTPLYLHELSSYAQLTGPYAAETEQGASYRPYPSSSEASIHLNTVVGINALTQQSEWAVRFVDCILSEPVQSLALGDGLPVNSLAAAENQKYDAEKEIGNYGISFHDEFDGGAEKGLTRHFSWPDPSYFEEFMRLVESADMFRMPDDRMDQLFRQEAESYFRKESSLSETIRSLNQKLELYQKE